jgi:hypothetical protein
MFRFGYFERLDRECVVGRLMIVVIWYEKLREFDRDECGYLESRNIDDRGL